MNSIRYSVFSKNNGNNNYNNKNKSSLTLSLSLEERVKNGATFSTELEE